MKSKSLSALLLVVLIGGATSLYLWRHHEPHDHADDHDHHHHGAHDEHEETPRGPHGGRLLAQDHFTLELAIVEAGQPPEFRAWFTRDDQPLNPAEVDLTVTLTRPGETTDTHTFSPEGDYARGAAEVYEPHSFAYAVTAVHAGRTYRWEFDAPEMQTTIPAAAARRAGVDTAIAGPAVIRQTLPVYGRIVLHADRVTQAAPRFAGLVREARGKLGTAVRAGETVAVVETNETLVTLAVTAPIDGEIVDRHANVGATLAAGQPLYTIANLDQVWAELVIPKADAGNVHPGQAVTIFAENGGTSARGVIDWLSPLGTAGSQSFTARVVLDNADRRWRPGLLITATITLGEETVPVAVAESALQTLHDFDVVFSQHGELYQARPLELGRRSDGFVEVTKGLQAGERYVTANSFLIKADIGKSGASHDH